MRRTAAAAVAALLLLPATGSVNPVERLIDDAARSIRKEAFEPARRSLDAAMRRIAWSGDRDAERRAQRWLGVLLDATGDVEGASRAFSRAIDLSRAARDRRGEASALRDRGFGHWRRAEYAAADRCAREALSIQIAEADAGGEGASVDLLGRIALKRGRTDEAVDLLGRAVTLRSAAGDAYGEVESRLGLLQTFLERREFDKAMEASRVLEMRAIEVGDGDVVVEALAERAIIWIVQGAPEAALEDLARGRSLAGAPPDPALLARLRHLEANALRVRGDHEGAVRAHEEAIAAYAELGNRREEAWNLARKSRSLAAMGRVEDADAALARALAIWDELRERRARAYWTYDRGRLLERAGRLEEAWRVWEDALRLEGDIALPYQALVLGDMAWLAARLGRTAEAGALSERAVASAERSEIPEMIWNALYRAALVERREGRRTEALGTLRRCLSVIEAMRRRVVPIDEALVGFLEEKQEVFAETVDLLMEMGRSGEALEVGERSRARAFLDLLGERPAPRAEALPTLAGVRDVVRRHRVTIVEYFVGPRRTFVWVIAPGEPVRGMTIAGGGGQWADRIGALRRSLGDETTTGSGDVVGLLRELTRDLWEPIVPWLPPTPSGRVTIIPHGALLVLPFASLVDSTGNYLVEKLTLDYAPSIAALDALEANVVAATHASAGCLAIGNPAGAPTLPALPGAETEAVRAAEALGGGNVLLGNDATEARVCSEAPAYAWIHFATHGVIRDDDPLESALLLAPSPQGPGGDDGRLTVREILDLDLRARLVTLSSCDSGLGRVTGEGMLGLCRSFLHAGAGSVVASLWRVSDLVGGFQMERFYDSLAAGRPPAHALRKAQLDTLAALRRGEIRTASGRPLPESPLFWAPYVLVGSGGA